ncbi:MAG: serine hydrolase [Pseudomonadota bacterium]
MNTDYSAQTIRRAYAGQLWPDEQIRQFATTERWFPTRRVARGRHVKELPLALHDFSEFTFSDGERRFDLYDYLSTNRIVGLLVMHRGAICLEHYEFSFTPDQRWMSMSMAKSISATLVGVALHEGAITSLEDPLTRYLPGLAKGAYRDVNVRQLLSMTSGVGWNETYTDSDSERRRMLELQIQQQPGSILEMMSGLPKTEPPGGVWNYSTGETHIVGALLKAATGSWLADYLSEKLWQPLGMEQDAEWWLESPGGLEVAGSGISATLRDYARFGALLLCDGLIQGKRVLPNGWIEAAAGSTDAIPYGYMWWPLPNVESAFCARGIFGQRIYIAPRKNLLTVILSARSKPVHAEGVNDDHFFRQLLTWLT